MSTDAATERDELNALSKNIVGSALRVHSELGSGLLESAYESCLGFQLKDLDYKVERQVPVPVLYRGRFLECGYRIDLLVEDRIIIEIKAVERLHRVHFSQLLSQLRLKQLKLGLLINFNVSSLRSGIHRVVSGFPDQ